MVQDANSRETAKLQVPSILSVSELRKIVINFEQARIDRLKYAQIKLKK